MQLALFGHPVAHSRSPEVHAEFGRQCGIALGYALIDVPVSADHHGDFGRALAAFIGAGGRGANVTVPFKLAAAACCTTQSATARRAGAVNTLVIAGDGGSHGDNTDGAGLIADLRHHGITLAGRRVALLGAGGAARGAAVALLDAGVAELTVANRDAVCGATFARDIPGTRGVDYAALRSAAFDLMINATSASLRDALPPLPEGALARGAIAYDMVYAPTPTAFQRWALAAGATAAHDGWGMMLEQAAASFALWTGVRPATAPLRDWLRDRTR